MAQAASFGPDEGGGRQVEGVVVIFKDDRNPVKRTTHFAGLALSVERFGLGECFRIERDDRVDRRTYLVISSDSGEVDLGQFFRRQRTLFKGGLKIGDGGVLDFYFDGAESGGGEERQRVTCD